MLGSSSTGSLGSCGVVGANRGSACFTFIAGGGGGAAGLSEEDALLAGFGVAIAAAAGDTSGPVDLMENFGLGSSGAGAAGAGAAGAAAGAGAGVGAGGGSVRFRVKVMPERFIPSVPSLAWSDGAGAAGAGAVAAGAGAGVGATGVGLFSVNLGAAD